ncbi:MAG: helix-turn-helix domain-containing protein [Planctomycetes bacterium]|nr:helix-turn-helix domain-containing protein [Planctomycetota bacterium]
MSYPTTPHTTRPFSASDYLSPVEFAHLSGLSLSTVRRYLASGRLPKVQPGGRRCRVLIPRNAIEVIRDPEFSSKEHDVTTLVDAPAISDPSSPPPSQHRGPAPRWTARC